MAISAIYTEQLADGCVQFGLSPTDFQKVQHGYGCPNCLEDFNGLYLTTCPVCGHERDVAQDFIDAPRHWLPDPNDDR